MIEPQVNDLISVEQAIAILDAVPVEPRIKTVALRESLGYRLAQLIVADRDYPPFVKAVMDGYAVRASDLGQVPVTLRVVGTVTAGATPQLSVETGQAMAIMTGAPLPPGADAVVPVELTNRDDVNTVRINRSVRVGNAIAARGSDIRKGVELLAPGTVIGPAQIAAAATVGSSQLSVFARPRVALLSTGDELVEIGSEPVGAQIRNSNAAMLEALLQNLGCEVENLGIACDERDELRTAIERGLASDALFVTGGMSMGERDFVPGLFNELGLEARISKLRIKPGKPFVFATDGKRTAFGLPGNPVSAFVCTLRLANRLISRMWGGPAEVGLFRAPIGQDLPANGPREFYQPAYWDRGLVMPLSWKGSADLFTLARANALIQRPENAPPVSSGKMITALLIPS